MPGINTIDINKLLKKNKYFTPQEYEHILSQINRNMRNKRQTNRRASASATSSRRARATSPRATSPRRASASATSSRRARATSPRRARANTDYQVPRGKKLIPVVNPIPTHEYIYDITSEPDEFGDIHRTQKKGVYSKETQQSGINEETTYKLMDGEVYEGVIYKEVDELFEPENFNSSQYRVVTNPKIGQRYLYLIGKDEFGKEQYKEGEYNEVTSGPQWAITTYKLMDDKEYTGKLYKKGYGRGKSKKRTSKKKKNKKGSKKKK